MSLWLFKNRHVSLFKRLRETVRDFSSVLGDQELPDESNETPEGSQVERSALRKSFRNAVKSMHALFDCGLDEYWSYRYRIGGPRLEKPITLIGARRVNEVIVNVVIPLCLSYFRDHNMGGEDGLRVFYRMLPVLGANRITKLMRRQLFGDKRLEVLDRSLVAQQGVQQIFRDFCSHDRGGCLDCPFPARVKKWTQRIRSASASYDLPRHRP